MLLQLAAKFFHRLILRCAAGDLPPSDSGIRQFDRECYAQKSAFSVKKVKILNKNSQKVLKNAF